MTSLNFFAEQARATWRRNPPKTKAGQKAIKKILNRWSILGVKYVLPIR